VRGRHGFVLGFLLGEVGLRRSARLVRRLIWLWGIGLLILWTWFRGLSAPVQSLVAVVVLGGLGFALVAGAQSRRRRPVWAPTAVYPGSQVLGEPGYVYRYVAPDGTLLYVGSTNDPDRRYREHAADRRPFVAPGVRFLVEQLPTREAAFDVEAAAIRTERPVYNVALNR
jgi:predicted GIY-YIG superfamily endonuclease